MIATKYEQIENVKKCKYCNNFPKRKITFYENGSKSEEIICDNDSFICLFDSYIEVKTTLDEAIKEWNKKN
jgi:hypothetical protein